MILALDLGNYNIKTSEMVCFPSYFQEGPNDNPLGEDVIIYDKKTYTMQKGDFDNTYNKALKNYIPNVLYALDKSSRVAKEFDLFLGVPADNTGIIEDFRKTLQNKDFEFKINGTVRKIKINRIMGVGEGISAFYSLPAELRALPTSVIDIGGRTVNVGVFQNHRLIKRFTVPQGMIDLYDNIAKRYNSNGNRVVAEQVNDLIDRGFIKDVHVEYTAFVKKIMNRIDKEVDRQFYNVYYCGGGAVRLEKQLLLYGGNLMPNPLFANVLGNRNIAKSQWGE